MSKQSLTIDITPAGLLSEDALEKFKRMAIGKSHRNERGEVMGEIMNVQIIDRRLIAEIKLNPGVILG